MKSSISKKQLREFGLLIGFGFPILIGWIFPAIGGHSFKIWTLWIAIPAVLLAITRSNLLKYPYKLWMKLGHTLGWINSHIILGIIFIIVLQPIAFIMHFFDYDPLRKKHKSVDSYREIRKNQQTDLTRIF